MRVEISLSFVVSLRPKGAAFGQAGSTRLVCSNTSNSNPAGVVNVEGRCACVVNTFVLDALSFNPWMHASRAKGGIVALTYSIIWHGFSMQISSFCEPEGFCQRSPYIFHAVVTLPRALLRATGQSSNHS